MSLDSSAALFILKYNIQCKSGGLQRVRRWLLNEFEVLTKSVSVRFGTREEVYLI